jgi:cysteine desulfuration protein SufE
LTIWDDRYRYLIELGRELPPLAEAAHSDASKVQVARARSGSIPVCVQMAQTDRCSHSWDSDAHIVRGAIAILLAIFSGRSAKDILATDALALFERTGLRQHLTPQRSKGFRSMVERIRADARAALTVAVI